MYRKKLIEVALPLLEINEASAYDKMPGIGAHPKGIHHWWARLPLPVARAVIFASVVDDPGEHPERFPTEEAQNRERERLFGIIRKMMQRNLHEHPEVYREAQVEMMKYCEGKMPPFLDPFAGGGSIPLEAARLGFEAYARDLNPVAVLLNICNLEIVPRWQNYPPVNPEARKQAVQEGWHGAGGLAEDVRYYGRRILERAKRKIGHLYPPVRVTEEMVAENPHLEPYLGRELPVIAWIWARTVPSPDPAMRGVHVPLLSTFWLSSKKGSEAYLEPVVEKSTRTWRFVVRTGTPKDREKVKMGTKLGRSGFWCLLSGVPIPFEYIRKKGMEGKLSSAMVAIVAESPNGRIYLPMSAEQVAVANSACPEGFPEADLPERALGFSVQHYGFRKYWELFTPRQLLALTTFSDLVREVRGEIEEDTLGAGLGEKEARDYTKAVATFLALVLDRCVDFNNSLCRWKPSGQQSLQLFARQAIPMVWDFVEPNIMGNKAVCWFTAIDICAEAMRVVPAKEVLQGHAFPLDVTKPWDGKEKFFISTDPPYYDNICYSALSDFFYVWLRRTIGDWYPELFSTILVPKEGELVASQERFGGDKRKAKEYFERGFRRAFTILREKMDPRFPLTVYYAFKQKDEESGEDEEESGVKERVDSTTGWETMLSALVETGFQITATWPVRSAQAWRMRAMGSNALASYIVLVCRMRPENAPKIDRRAFLQELKKELPEALRRLKQGNIAPVDFAQAAIGPGMAVYSRYSQVLEASGRPMSVRTALALINQILSEVLAEEEDEFDNATRWAIAWFEQHGFGEGDFGEAELLSKAKVTSVETLVSEGLVFARQGKVRLRRPEEYPKDFDAKEGGNHSVWVMTHQVLRVYVVEKAGDMVTARLLRQFGGKQEYIRDLSYRLFRLAERRNHSQDAQMYNTLILGWPELTRMVEEVDSLKYGETGKLL
ncbi:MAG: DUF1156 domain-containing protein [Candidatus Atribacteria bacterium]|nr:DUF1156 domain-containing protein [Candidatus Atribacteria bacterium]